MLCMSSNKCLLCNFGGRYQNKNTRVYGKEWFIKQEYYLLVSK